MANRQSSQLIDAAKEDRARANYEPACSQTFHSAKTASKSCSLLALRTWSSSPRLRAADSTSRACRLGQSGIGWIDKRAMTVAVGRSSCSNSSRFGCNLYDQTGHARNIAARPVQVSDEAEPDWVAPVSKTIGMVVVAAFAASAAGVDGRSNHSHLTLNQVRRHRGQPINLLLRPAVFDRHVLALDITGFF